MTARTNPTDRELLQTVNQLIDEYKVAHGLASDTAAAARLDTTYNTILRLRGKLQESEGPMKPGRRALLMLLHEQRRKQAARSSVVEPA